MNDRNKLFAIPNGPLAKSMAKFMRGIVKINNNIFCHGGVSEVISEKYNVKEVNNVLEAYLKGQRKYEDTLFQDIYGRKDILLKKVEIDFSFPDEIRNNLKVYSKFIA